MVSQGRFWTSYSHPFSPVLQIVKLLLKFGADPYQKNQHIKTAIDIACYLEILQMLENTSKNDIHTGVSAVNKGEVWLFSCIN